MMLMMLGSVRGSHDAHLWGGYVVVTVLVCIFSVVRRFGTESEIDVIDALSGKLPVHVRGGFAIEPLASAFLWCVSAG